MHHLVTAWIEYLDVELGRLPTTIERYVRVLEELIASLDTAPKPTALPLESLGKKHLRQFLRSYAGRGGAASAASWNLGLGALRSFYGFLFEEEIIPLNPALRIRRRRVTGGQEPLPLSLDEFYSLTDAIQQGSNFHRTRNAAIVTVFLQCGIRVKELVSLDLDQVDFRNELLLNVRTKGNKILSKDLNKEAAAALKRYLEDRPHFGAPDSERALFLSQQGRRIAVRTVQAMVKAYSHRAGISRSVGPHLLRHSIATVLDEMNVSVSVIQDICGHESIATTRRYIHVRDRNRRETSRRLGRHTASHRRRRTEGGAHAAAC
jgi:site-specific recombinase XerD